MTGADLREAREISGKLQKDIAKETGIDTATICRYELGHRDAGFIRFENLLTAYGYRIIPPHETACDIAPYPAPKIDRIRMTEWERIDEAVRKILSGAIHG